MLATFEAILPIFLLIVGGNLLRRTPLINEGAWAGLEQMGFWFLYPALLFITIVKADFSGLALDAMMVALLVSVALMCALTYSLWPVVDRLGLTRHGEFSSIFQTAVRWNGFMALAIAEKIFPPAGAAVVALVMAVIIVPINIASVFVVTKFADRASNWPTVFRRLATNPLIIASLAGLLVRLLPNGLYGPLLETFDLVGRAALGMGLISIGAGLRPTDMLTFRTAVWLPVVLKLAVFPVILIALALTFGVTGQQLAYLALCAAVPTAMNGFLLARQLGGDAELYATVTTLQTAVSFLTIPAVLGLTAYIAG
jgi:malonate transporter